MGYHREIVCSIQAHASSDSCITRYKCKRATHISNSNKMYCNESSPELEAWFILLHLHHELVDVDELGSCRDLRKWGHAKHTAESVIILNQKS